MWKYQFWTWLLFHTLSWNKKNQELHISYNTWEYIEREIERCNVYHPSLLPVRWHEPRCLYRPTENSQTWMSHSVKGQTFQRIQRGNLVGSLGNHRWSQIERPSRGDPESKQRFIFFFYIMASHKMYKVSSKQKLLRNL